MPAYSAARTFVPPPGRTPPRGRRRARRTAAAHRAAATAPGRPAPRTSGNDPVGPTEPAIRGTRDTRDTRDRYGTGGTRAVPTGGTGDGPQEHAAVSARTPAHDAAAEMVRWATFCCAVVPAVLVAYGASVGGAIAAAAGLAAVTGACNELMRRSAPAPPRPAGPRGRRGGGRRGGGRRARRTARD
ncbi:hypothetical protein SCWH03_01740 [Streptomyces pacificus]|uniref:Uncharacterized protein n=1 Tax=Streptomyces pacificus TaxID=2705029 RepID=A0A6A0ALZ1_9ACTN|nr:hypothetical protein SCWH03_01740 [Streptomyces pacificus]